ncbi:MAG: hypothetical protein AAF368_12585 [Planctomycetota bacterium]
MTHSFGTPGLRVWLPLALSVALLFWPRDASLEFSRLALCFAPWLLLTGVPGPREASRSEGTSTASSRALRAATVPVALALPVLAVAAPRFVGLQTIVSLVTAGLLLFLLAYATECAASTALKSVHLFHALAWMLLFPGTLALGLASEFAAGESRAAKVKDALAWAPCAVLVTQTMQPRPAPWAHVPAAERTILATNAGFARVLDAQEQESSWGLGRTARDVLPALLACVLLAGLASLGGRKSTAEPFEVER